MVRCINCDTEYEHADELDHEEVDEIELIQTASAYLRL